MVGRHAPVPGAGRFPPGFYFFVSRLLRVVARVEQAVEQGLIQCGRVAPRVDDHAVDVRRIQHQFHGVLQGVVRHGAGRRAAVHTGRSAGGEQRQPGTVLVFQGPERKPSGLLLRDGVLGPGGRGGRRARGRLQRHQNMGLQLQRVVQGPHQGPEALLVLPVIQPLDRLLDCRAAGAAGAVAHRRARVPAAAHRAEAHPAVCSSCHCMFPAFLQCHLLV